MEALISAIQGCFPSTNSNRAVDACEALMKAPGSCDKCKCAQQNMPVAAVLGPSKVFSLGLQQQGHLDPHLFPFCHSSMPRLTVLPVPASHLYNCMKCSAPGDLCMW